MLKVLLIEPAYNNKYPPLGLMKISSFHKKRGDEVFFFKGENKDLKNERWDRIYITSLFTFYWKQTIDTILYYKDSVKELNNIFVGGVLATLLSADIEKATGIKPVRGLLNERGKVRIDGDESIDGMVPDYDIIDTKKNSLLNYQYPVSNAYFGYMTRGCIRGCKFCAVSDLEPTYVDYSPIKEQIRYIEKKEPKKDLMLLDNNVLASKSFHQIIDDIIELGFFKGATLNKAGRYVDFNQGLDARLLSEEKMARFAEIPLRPMRIAFDRIEYKEIYEKAVRLAAKYHQPELSNYILFNTDSDTPDDFYERLKINIELNEELGTQIFSFPMKFSPIYDEAGYGYNKNRTFVGKHWNKRFLRGIQCILASTHGVVGPRKKFFKRAFGRDVSEFKKIISMPDEYILYREINERNGLSKEWGIMYDQLSEEEKTTFEANIGPNKPKEMKPTGNIWIDWVLAHHSKDKKAFYHF